MPSISFRQDSCCHAENPDGLPTHFIFSTTSMMSHIQVLAGRSVGRSSISCEHSSRSTNSGALGQNTSLAGEGKLERRQHLRVHGVLRVPSMALQRPYSRVAVELGEVYELLDCRLLLSAVYCRHRVLAPRIRPRVQTPSVCCCGVERRVGRAECAVLGTRQIVN